MQFIKKVKQKPRTIDNIVNIYSCPSLYIPKDVVQLLLDLGDQVDIAHNYDLKDLLAAMDHDGENEVVIREKKLLIEERGQV